MPVLWEEEVWQEMSGGSWCSLTVSCNREREKKGRGKDGVHTNLLLKKRKSTTATVTPMTMRMRGTSIPAAIAPPSLLLPPPAQRLHT